MPFHYFWMPSLNGKLGRRWFWKVLTSHHDTCVALCVRVRVSVRVNVRVCVPSWSVSHPHTHGQRKKCVVIITHMFGWRRKNERQSGNTSIIGQQRLQQKTSFHQFLTLQRQFFHPIRDREQKELEFCGQQESFSTLDERLIWKTNFANHPLMMKHGSKGSGASKKRTLRNYSER